MPARSNTSKLRRRAFALLGKPLNEHPNHSPSHRHHSPPTPPASGESLLHVYWRILIERFRSLSLVGLSDRDDLAFDLFDLYVQRTLVPTDTAAGGAELPEGPALLAKLLNASGARLLIVGGAGSGKSTYLAQIALACAGDISGESHYPLKAAGGWLDSNPLPIFVDLDELQPVSCALGTWPHPQSTADEQQVAHPTCTCLWNQIKQQLERDALEQFAPLLQRQLLSGNCLILLDGIDSHTDMARTHALATVIGQFAATYPANRYIISCRKLQPTIEPLAAFDSYLLSPLDDTQMRDMIARWYTAIARRSDPAMPQQLEDRIATLQQHLSIDAELWKLARTPMVLALCILVHADRWPMPITRGIIYQRLLDIMLDRWEQTHPARETPRIAQVFEQDSLLDLDLRLALLQPLAFEFHSRSAAANPQSPLLEYQQVAQLICAACAALGQNAFPPTDQAVAWLIEHCCRIGLLEHSAQPTGYTMPYSPLRAYLAARALAQMGDFPNIAYRLRNDPAWREVIPLATQELGRDPTPHTYRAFLRLLLSPPQDAAPPQQRQWSDALLAAECLHELGAYAELEAELSTSVQHHLLQITQTSSCPTPERIRAGLLLGNLGDPRFDGPLPPLVLIEGGKFIFGHDHADYEDEGPAQRIDLPPFSIGIYPVTNREYARFLAHNPTHPRPRYWHDPRFNNPSQPVVGVTWHDANAYARWLTDTLSEAGLLPAGSAVRLPLESEWEKAAGWDPKRRRKRLYPWGDQWSSERANTAQDRGAWATTPVGCYPTGVSAYGVYDMVGNVWEWTASEYTSYPGARNPFHDPGNYVLRGSSCVSLPTHVRCTFRSRLPANYWRYHLGFRIVIARPLASASEEKPNT